MNEKTQTYGSLTLAQKEFVETDKINTKMSIPKWIKFLEPICRFDESADRIRKKLNFLVVLSSFGFFIPVFIAIFTTSLTPLYGTAIFFIALVLLVKQIKKYNKRDVNNNIRNVIYPLLKVFSLDVGHAQSVAMRINFNKPLTAENLASELTETSEDRHIGTSEYYLFDVLDVRTAFVDGTRVQMSVFDKIRQRERCNPRGKTKIKHKLKRRIIISVKFDKKLYRLPDSNINNEASDAIKISSSDNWIKFKVLIKQSVPGKTGDLPMDKILENIHYFYQYLTIKEQKA